MLKKIILTLIYLVNYSQSHQLAWPGGIGPLCVSWDVKPYPMKTFTWWTDQLLSLSALTLLVDLIHKIVPYMTYNVFGGTLNPTQSVNQLHT